MSVAQALVELQEPGTQPYKREIRENKANQSAYNQATTTVTHPYESHKSIMAFYALRTL